MNSERPNVEVTGALRRGALAVACPVDRPVRHSVDSLNYPSSRTLANRLSGLTWNGAAGYIF